MWNATPRLPVHSSFPPTALFNHERASVLEVTTRVDNEYSNIRTFELEVVFENSNYTYRTFEFFIYYIKRLSLIEFLAFLRKNWAITQKFLNFIKIFLPFGAIWNTVKQSGAL